MDNGEICPRPPLLSWGAPPSGFPPELVMCRGFRSAPWVDLWFLSVDRLLQREGVTPYHLWLSPAELQRSDRFKFDILRQRFIVMRGMLRALVGFYQGQDPGQVEFTYSDRGKPHIVPVSGQEPLHVNLSHSLSYSLSHALGDSRNHGQNQGQSQDQGQDQGQQYALYGFSDRPLGVDLEGIGKQRDILGIAQRFFAPDEQRVLRQADPQTQEIIFLRHWVCKEAILKATGEGLSGNLQTTAIAFHPLAHLHGTLSQDLSEDLPGNRQIILQELTPSPNTIAALAVVISKP